MACSECGSGERCAHRVGVGERNALGEWGREGDTEFGDDTA